MTPSLSRQLLHPRCPRCGKGKLFKDILSIVDVCAACGFDLKNHDAADGPAFFAITLVGFLVVGLASVVERRYEPPMWLHAVVWLPFTVIACILVLRLFKVGMITLEYRLSLQKGQDSDAV